MFSLRKEQIDSMSTSSREVYRRRLVRFFRRTLPEPTKHLNEEALSAVITESTRRAQAHGIVGGTALVKFIRIALLTTPLFDEHPAVRRYFDMPDLDPDFKMDLLADLIAQKLKQRTS